MTNVRDLLEQLVSFDSVNPTLVPGGAGEAEIGRFVATWLEEHGVAAHYGELAPRERTSSAGSPARAAVVR